MPKKGKSSDKTLSFAILNETVPITLLLDAANPADVATAARLLREHKLVAFPTETVYGLGANALDADAVAGIFAAKQRPSWDPLIVHIASIAQLPQLATIPPELASRIDALVAAFWPGPLTLLLSRTEAVPDAVTDGRELVGIRIPAHPVARALLEAAALPLAAPSANTFGHTSPTTAAHVLADLEGRIDAVIDGGATTVGVESTVLDPTQTPMVLYRPGAILPEQITAATGVAVEVFVPPSANAEPVSLPSPGVGIRHYAPRATLILSEGGEAELNANVYALLERNPTTMGVLVPSNWRMEADVEIESWGNWDAPEALAAQLFGALRSMDDRGVTLIVVPLPESGGLRDALRDRLMKAAREK